MKYILLLIPFLIVKYSSFGQTGCTDPQAINFDSLAIINDGSCVYPATTLNLNLESVLDTPLLNECSGIAVIDGKLWVEVDNSDTSIYRIDSISNMVFQSLAVNNVSNTDWEDVTTSEDYFFIGDFGNNYGNRTDLHILKIPKPAINDTAISVDVQFINFTYSDQVNFTSALNINSFDCEAFFFRNDSLHLFTKDWVTKWTKHYILPADSGTFVAQLVDSFNVNGLITSAAIQQDGLLVLLGYDNTGIAPCFLWMFNDYSGNSFFSGNKRMFALGSAAMLGQTEGICFSGTNSGFITNEHFHQLSFDVPAQIKSFDLSPYLSQLPTSVTRLNKSSNVNFTYLDTDNKLVVKIMSEKNITGQFIITDASGKIISSEKIIAQTTLIDTKAFSPGLYFVQVPTSTTEKSSFRFFKK